MRNFLWRTLVIFHRYLGIAVGILMLVWFASGIVMMYVGFPRLTEQERLSALAPIPWQACCRVADGLIPDDQQFYRVQIENLLGVPVLRLRRPPRPDLVIDLVEGVGVRRFDSADARAIALDTVTRTAGPATVASAATIDEDQWTVGRYRRDRPLHRFTFDDPQRSTIYVSSTSGQVVLRTTSMQRFWNWLGAIPHWFYLTALRSDGPLWSQTVIWASILGTFLTVLRSVNAVSLTTAPFAGKLFWLATAADGTVTRFDASGNAAPLSEAELARAAERIVGANGISAQGILREEDAYYFSHHDQVVLPVYRIIANDAENTRYYLDPTSGALLRRADANARWHRWLFAGLHRFDFAAWLRARPAWDIIVITLVLGGLAASATGVCLAVRRIHSDVAMLIRQARGVRPGSVAQGAP